MGSAFIVLMACAQPNEAEQGEASMIGAEVAHRQGYKAVIAAVSGQEMQMLLAVVALPALVFI